MTVQKDFATERRLRIGRDSYLRSSFCDAFRPKGEPLDLGKPLIGRTILVHDTVATEHVLTDPRDGTFMLQSSVTEYRLTSVSFRILRLDLRCMDLPMTQRQRLVVALSLQDAPHFLVKMLTLPEEWEKASQPLPLLLYDGWDWNGNAKQGNIHLASLLSDAVKHTGNVAPLSIELL